MSRDLGDREVVDAFVAYRATTDHRGIAVQNRPDENERNETAIDAIAGPLAIEHTSIDTVDGQRRDGARFMGIVAELESELSPKMTSRLTIVFPYDGIQTGQNWTVMKTALRNWIVSDAVDLPDGSRSMKVPDLPFEIEVEKAGPATDRQPGLFFAQRTPLEPDLPARLRRLIERKAAKLGPHRASGRTTVLLLESDDIALMNRWKLAQAISEGSQRVFQNRSTSSGTLTRLCQGSYRPFLESRNGRNDDDESLSVWRHRS